MTAPRSVPYSTRWTARSPRSPATVPTTRTASTPASPSVIQRRPLSYPALHGRAQQDGRDRANPARPPPPAYRRAGPQGVAEGVRVHEAGPRRGHHRPVQARDRGRAALAHKGASGHRDGRGGPRAQPHAGAGTPELRLHCLTWTGAGVIAPAPLIPATRPRKGSNRKRPRSSPGPLVHLVENKRT